MVEKKRSNLKTRLSVFIMGFACITGKQPVKGIIYLLIEAAFIFYMATFGVPALSFITTLGKTQQGMVFDEDRGIYVKQQGDNSMLILLSIVATLFVIAAFVVLWRENMKSARLLQKLTEEGKHINSFKEDVAELFNGKLQKTLLSLPVLSLLVFNVLPLVFMILIAFTNFDSAHQPPGKLFTWVGFDNFKTMLNTGSLIGETFWPILGWTFVWAVFSTFLNYFFGMLLALVINRKGTKLKALWRTVFTLSIAVPQFVSLLIMRTLLQEQGPVNVLLKELGIITQSIPFFTNGLLAKITVIVVNLWVGIPYGMLICTGILQNIPEDYYEAARVDGANAVVTFFKITLPYMLFVTTPYLITQFVGNLNNFNVIYFLSSGGPETLDYYQAGKTDLLVTWLYKLTTNSFDYSYAAVIGILVFVISAVLSLITYRKTGAYNNEEGYQ